MRIIYAGTPEFALPALTALAHSGHELVAVYTQPDRPRGRGRKLSPSPVKAQALALGLAVEQPTHLRDAATQTCLAAYAPDLMVVAAYGLILPQAVLDIPALGCINLHASLLPRWRGAAPVTRALLAGDAQSGITLMQMNAGLDTGDILMRRELSIAADDSSASLEARLAELGGQLLVEALPAIEVGDILAQPQPEAGVCYAHKLDKDEGRIDWQQDADTLARRIRAYNPRPVAHAELDGERWRLWQASTADSRVPTDAAPGQILQTTAAGIDVACSSGCLRITELQWPGGRRLSARDACNGRNLVGKRFH